jgi:hypothetical protein
MKIKKEVKIVVKVLESKKGRAYISITSYVNGNERYYDKIWIDDKGSIEVADLGGSMTFSSTDYVLEEYP